MAYLLQQARRVAFDSNKSPERQASPQIQRLKRSAPLSLFIEALEKDGCVIISDFTDESTLRQADEEIRPWLEHEDEGAVVGGRLLIHLAFLPFLTFLFSPTGQD